MRHLLLTLISLSIASCDAQTPTPKEVATGQADGVPATPAAAPLAPDAAPPPSTAAGPLLSTVSRAEFEPRLDPGAGCTLARDGDDLIVAVIGDGVAKVDGRVVDLTGVPTDYNALAAGGRFSGGGATIQVTLAPDLGEGDSVGETSTKPARVKVISAGRTDRFEAAWTCGS